MSLSLYRKLGIRDAKHHNILQLADSSIKHPKGIIEDDLVKLDMFIYHADFIVLDMEEDRDIPIILGRPFMTTGRALIDVHKGTLTLRVNDENENLNIYQE
ncbi:unnamed protein product [Fraxinus pennsylvanica]|uniref:Uncharacterized protein n=1 Tax=Fraxinus pennsylvanica TaxID=56036 RepID=A0AAD2DMS8_9LAMI|nr:unnamed protein product [Fraxinus pennsylvanica]